MSFIDKYIIKPILKLTDKIIITDKDNLRNETKNAQLSDVVNLVLENLGIESSGKLKITEINIEELTTDVATTVNQIPEYIVSKSEIVFINIAGNGVYVLKNSDITIGDDSALVNDDFLLLAGESGINSLIEATDFPSTYAGNALKLLRVNAGGTAVEFVTDDSIKQVAIGGTNLTITSGTVTIPNASLTGAGLVNIDIINDQNLGKGNKTITLSGNTSTAKGFIVKGSDNNTKFGVLENNFIESNVQHVFRNGAVINQPFPLLQLFSDGNYVWIRKIQNQLRIGNGVAQGNSTLALEVDKNIASIGESSQAAGVGSQKGCLEVKSDTRGSIPAPIMTQTQRLAITELTPGLQVTQISSDSLTIQGVYIYISTVVGWKKILIEA